MRGGWFGLFLLTFIGSLSCVGCSPKERETGVNEGGTDAGGAGGGGGGKIPTDRGGSSTTAGQGAGATAPTTGGTDSGGTDGTAGSSGQTDPELKPQGEACASNDDCESSFCVDGVCCDSACEGECVACTEASTSASDGTCAPVLAGADPDDDCDVTGGETCGNDGNCDGAGACRKYGANQLCGAASCSGSTYSAARTCDGSGACDPATTTACGEDPCSEAGCEKPCSVPADCPTGSYCSTTQICRNQLTDGATCSAANQCRSGFCVDGVCCESACTGTCAACSKAKTGQDSGRCVGVPANQDPDNECAVDSANACGRDGTCSGGGACRVQSLGIACGTAACSGSTLTPQGKCDGASSCTGASAQQCPGNLTCASSTACRTSCTADSHCNSGYYCSGGSCAKKKSDGGTCSAANECSSGSCRDGVCCESACSLACQACSNATTGLANGKCGARSGSSTQACPAANPTACVNLSSDVNNCGSCGNSCPSSSIAGATRTCTNGVCGAACPAGTLGDGLNVCIPVTTIAAAQTFSCALLETGKISCWGELGGGIDPSGAGVSGYKFTSISAKYNQICGLRDSGQAVCWGAAPSTHTGPYIAIANGDYHACAIKANQSLECWSWDGDSVIQTEPSGKYKGIAAMNHYACAIISGGANDGKLSCWGDSANYEFRPPPTVAFTRVVGGSSHACGIKPDKTITCWGILSYPNYPPSTQFKTLGTGGGTHYCGIMTDDTIFCWGSDGGEGGPAASEPAGSFKAVALGSNHTCGVTTAGRVVCAGNDTYGQAQNQPGPFQGYW